MVDLRWPAQLPLGNRLNPLKEHCSIPQPTASFCFLSFSICLDREKPGMSRAKHANTLAFPEQPFWSRSHSTDTSPSTQALGVTVCSEQKRQLETGEAFFKEHCSKQWENINRCTSRSNGYNNNFSHFPFRILEHNSHMCVIICAQIIIPLFQVWDF